MASLTGQKQHTLGHFFSRHPFLEPPHGLYAGVGDTKIEYDPIIGVSNISKLQGVPRLKHYHTITGNMIGVCPSSKSRAQHDLQSENKRRIRGTLT